MLSCQVSLLSINLRNSTEMWYITISVWAQWEKDRFILVSAQQVTEMTDLISEWLQMDDSKDYWGLLLASRSEILYLYHVIPFGQKFSAKLLMELYMKTHSAFFLDASRMYSGRYTHLLFIYLHYIPYYLLRTGLI